MNDLLATLAAFLGTMFVFALAAQSIQEIVKTMLVVRSRTLIEAIDGLVREASRANQQWSIDADAILRQVMRRLGALGQSGIRTSAIRLDRIAPEQLADLIAKVEPADVPGLPGDRAEAREILRRIGEQARDWFPLAVAPVDDRYRRRMRVYALLSSALVVVPFNLDAFRVLELSRANPEYRAEVEALTLRLDSLRRVPPDSAAIVVPDSTAAADTTIVAAADSLRLPADGRVAAATLSDADWAALRGLLRDDLLSQPALEDLRRPRWWLGILLSIALVSLGAPFWHDLLEAVFGLKRRLIGGALPAAPAVPPDGDGRRPGAAR